MTGEINRRLKEYKFEINQEVECWPATDEEWRGLFEPLTRKERAIINHADKKMKRRMKTRMRKRNENQTSR